MKRQELVLFATLLVTSFLFSSPVKVAEESRVVTNDDGLKQDGSMSRAHYCLFGPRRRLGLANCL